MHVGRDVSGGRMRIEDISCVYLYIYHAILTTGLQGGNLLISHYNTVPSLHIIITAVMYTLIPKRQADGLDQYFS